MELVLLLLGLAIGAGVAWFAARASVLAQRGTWMAERADLERGHSIALADAHAEVTELHREIAHLGGELVEARAAGRSEEQLIEALRVAGSDVMSKASQQVVEMAEQRYARLEEGAETKWTEQGRVVSEHLAQISKKVTDLETEHKTGSSRLDEQIRGVMESTAMVGREAQQLSSAMRDSRLRGNWGEVQLKRVLELSGMEPFFDYVEQSGSWSDDSNARPDVVVRLPNDRCIVIDAKVPCDRFLEAANTADPAEQQRLMLEHARSVLSHVQALSKRNYSAHVTGAIDFVVMFLPGEPMLSAAFEARSQLFEEAAKLDVLIVTPTSLLGLLRAVAVGWREQRLAEDAAQISALGAQLYERIGVFASHYAKLGKHLSSAVKSFNDVTGSLEGRVLPSARKMGELVSGKELIELDTIELTAREASAREMLIEVEELPAVLELVDPSRIHPGRQAG